MASLLKLISYLYHMWSYVESFISGLIAGSKYPLANALRVSAIIMKIKHAAYIMFWHEI